MSRRKSKKSGITFFWLLEFDIKSHKKFHNIKSVIEFVFKLVRSFKVSMELDRSLHDWSEESYNFDKSGKIDK